MTGYIVYSVALLFLFVNRGKHRLVDYVAAVLLALLMGFNSYNADYDAYCLNYVYLDQTLDSISQLPGYVVLERMGHFLQLDYSMFRFVFGLISILLIYDLAHRLCDNPSLVLFCYALTPFFYDVTQFRFALAASLALWSISFLTGARKGGKALFMFGVIAAGSIHPAALFFLCLLPAVFSRRRALTLAIVGFLTILIANQIGLTSSLADSLLNSERSSRYFSMSGGFGFLQYWVCLAALCMLTTTTEFATPRSPERKGSSPKDYFCELFEKMTYLIFLVAAFMPQQPLDFYRPIRSFYILAYVYFVIRLADGRVPKKQRVLLGLGAVCWLLLVVGVTYASLFNDLVTPVFENNYLW